MAASALPTNTRGGAACAVAQAQIAGLSPEALSAISIWLEMSPTPQARKPAKRLHFCLLVAADLSDLSRLDLAGSRLRLDRLGRNACA
jgi:hypothetical protein